METIPTSLSPENTQENARLQQAVLAGLRQVHGRILSLKDAGKEKVPRLNRYGEMPLTADLEAEATIIEAIKSAIGGKKTSIRVISEEHGTIILGDSLVEPSYMLVLDGLDGSSNYFNDKDSSGTMVGIYPGINPKFSDCQFSAIAIHEPESSESIIYYATEKGVFMQRDDEPPKPIHTASVRTIGTLDNLPIYADTAMPFVKALTEAKLKGLKVAMRGSAALYHADIAQGKAAAVIFDKRKDDLELAASFRLLKEAGAVIIDLKTGDSLDGEDYKEIGKDAQNRPYIIAATLPLARELRDLLLPSWKDVARLELQMPTRLLRDYKNYTTSPDLSSSTGQMDRRWDAYAYELYERAKSLYAFLSPAEKQKLDTFRKRKTALFTRFARHYSSVVEVLHESGLWGSDVIEKFDEKGDISFRIISEHSLVVGKVAEVLASSMAEKLLEEKIRRENIPKETVTKQKDILRRQAVGEVVLGSLLQDVNKRVEIEFKAQDAKSQKEQIGELVAQGFGTKEDLLAIEQNPEKAAGIFERLLQEKTKNAYNTDYKDEFSRYGNIDTIIACSKSSGMPVVSFPQAQNGHYLPTLAQRIANYADKLVQDTGLVTDLGRRHEVVLTRYSPKELVDKEFKYVASCAEEFAHMIQGVKRREEIPLFVLNTIVSQIEEQGNK